jgi:hypothetical protein
MDLYRFSVFAHRFQHPLVGMACSDHCTRHSAGDSMPQRRPPLNVAQAARWPHRDPMPASAAVAPAVFLALCGSGILNLVVGAAAGPGGGRNSRSSSPKRSCNC